MNLPLESITLHTNPAAAALSYGGITNVLPSAKGEVRARYRVRGMPTIDFSVGAGTPFGQAAIAGTAFTIHQTLSLNYSGGEKTLWRVEEATVSADGDDIKVSAWPYWTMLDRRRVRIARNPTGYVDLSLALVNVTALEALTESFSNNPAPYFAVGTVDASLSGALISIDLNGSTHLDALNAVCEALTTVNNGLPAEFEPRVVGSTTYIDIIPFVGASATEKANGYTPDPTKRPIDGPTGGAGTTANRLGLKRRMGGRDYFNRIIPLAGPQDSRVTIARAFWPITSAVYDGFTDTTVITLEDAPLAAPFADPTGSLYFGTEAAGYFLVENLTSSSIFRVDGDASSLTIGRFAVDSAGTELVSLENAQSADDDIAEQIVDFPDFVPYENLFRSIAGISEDFSDWETDTTPGSPNAVKPKGLTYGGSGAAFATIEKIAAAGNENYVRHGKFSVKVTLPQYGSIRIGEGLFSFEPTDTEKTICVSINAAVESGTIRLDLIDSGGRRHPEGSTKADTSSKSLVALMIGGMEADAGAAYVEVTGVSDGETIFYLDAVNPTRSTEAYQYAAESGPRDLWIAGLDYLRKRGGEQYYFETGFIDATVFDNAKWPAEIGSYVQIRDGWDGSAYRITDTGRVMELEVRYSMGGKPIQRRVKVANERPDVTGRFVSPSVSAKILSAPAQERFSEYFESTFTSSINGDALITLAGDHAAGSYTELVGDVRDVDIAPGTQLEIRTMNGDSPVVVYTTGPISPETFSSVIPVSSVVPIWESVDGVEMKEPAFLLNGAAVVLSRLVKNGTGLYLPAIDYSNTIKQTSLGLLALQKKVETNLALGRIAVIGEEVRGETSVLENLILSTRVALRTGWQLTILTDRGPQNVIVSEDTLPGSTSIPISAEELDIREGDIVSMDPLELVAFLRIEPGEVETRVQLGREAVSLAILDQNLPSGQYSNIPILPLTVTLRAGDSYILETKSGAIFPITLSAPAAINAVNLSINPTTFPDPIIGGIVRFGESATISRILTAEGEIDVRVRVGEVVAAINLTADIINGANVAITGDTTFAAGYDPTERALDTDTVHVGDAAQDINDNTTLISGAKIVTGSIQLDTLAFTPGDVDSATIVATIKASAEGLKIDADLLEISGVIEAGNGIQSSDYVAGVSGWQLGGSGDIELILGTSFRLSPTQIEFGGNAQLLWNDAIGGNNVAMIAGNGYANNKAIAITAGTTSVLVFELLDQVTASAGYFSAGVITCGNVNADVVGGSSFVPDIVPDVTGSISSALGTVVTSLLTALEGLGLITDSTTA
jgi:hypothetical protein